jgi:hypothetical protein
VGGRLQEHCAENVQLLFGRYQPATLQWPSLIKDISSSFLFLPSVENVALYAAILSLGELSQFCSFEQTVLTCVIQLRPHPEPGPRSRDPSEEAQVPGGCPR